MPTCPASPLARPAPATPPLPRISRRRCERRHEGISYAGPRGRTAHCMLGGVLVVQMLALRRHLQGKAGAYINCMLPGMLPGKLSHCVVSARGSATADCRLFRRVSCLAAAVSSMQLKAPAVQPQSPAAALSCLYAPTIGISAWPTVLRCADVVL
jgi:hypothetical protein